MAFQDEGYNVNHTSFNVDFRSLLVFPCLGIEIAEKFARSSTAIRLLPD
jgi:hypothetical protein